MAVVVETYEGTDSNVRSVKIKTTSGIYNRPITKLCLLLSMKNTNQVNKPYNPSFFTGEENGTNNYVTNYLSDLQKATHHSR